MQYLYTDPLVAAYMAREFGAIYTQGNKDVANPWKLDDFTKIINSNDFFKKLYFYIHPDSETIFEPKDGDIIKNPAKHQYGKTGWRYTIVSERNLRTNCCSLRWAKILIKRGNKIVERNGKPFFMPEVEK